MNKFSCWVEVTLECNVVSDATVSNLGICEVEHYRHMFSGLLVALWVGEEFSLLEHWWVGDDVLVLVNERDDIVAIVWRVEGGGDSMNNDWKGFLGDC